ncbi:MAG: MBL fold metallo-hydrolase [Muribaculaceae bacterium]|nr:MBL fold metallo-hydrolase [Muribaculaceae bacterium]
MISKSTQLIMLGTGNAMCTRCYNTCFYLRTPGGGLMVDAGGGNGIFRQLYKARVSVEEVKNLFVTHVHTDHILGVVWLIRKISPMIHKGKHTAPFTIYCNDEVANAVRTLCRLTIPSKICSAIDDTIILREVNDGECVEIDDLKVTFFDIGTTKSKQYGFQATLPDGQVLTCLGDEPYNPVNERYVRGCDWLMCEAFCLYGDRTQFNPYEKNHSTALDAGRQAQEMGVKKLLLYHTEDTHLSNRRLTYTAEAAKHFTGRIEVPDDLETVDL